MTNNTEIIFTDQQLKAIEMPKYNKISVLSGGPGTGKTTTTKAIIDWAISKDLKVSQAAPTGKAAKRMAEATNFYASTIHSMLGCEFDSETGRFKFICNKSNPLPTDLIILDEISMITNDLMARVLEAVDIDRTRLLLIGDPDQLPSVGAGAVLRDLLASFATAQTKLDIIHRNCGEIVKACHKIKDGKIYTPHKKLDLKAESPINLVHIERFSPEDTLSCVEKLMCEVIPKKYGYDPIEDIQIISPVNKKGSLSCESINGVLRDRLNPIKPININDDFFNNSEIDNSYKFRVGDKVINTKNDKAPLIKGGESAIVNGDIGIVQKVNKKDMIILFSDPAREVKILKSNQHLLHAYCITCHRFQGSEAPVIIIPVSAQFNFFLSNPWIYTAISRAKVICITVGSFGTIEKAIRNITPNNRVTMLKERIIEAEDVLIGNALEEI